MTQIALSWHEVRLAAEVGVARNVVALSRGWTPHQPGACPPLWQAHIVGAIGELAFAKATNRYWTGDPAGPPDKVGDVGSGLQVRACDRPNGSLILHDHDDDDHRFVLVTGGPCTLDLAGWVLAREVKRPEFWRKDVPEPAYFVPARDLHPMETLPQ